MHARIISDLKELSNVQHGPVVYQGDIPPGATAHSGATGTLTIEGTMHTGSFLLHKGGDLIVEYANGPQTYIHAPNSHIRIKNQRGVVGCYGRSTTIDNIIGGTINNVRADVIGSIGGTGNSVRINNTNVDFLVPNIKPGARAFGVGNPQVPSDARVSSQNVFNISCRALGSLTIDTKAKVANSNIRSGDRVGVIIESGTRKDITEEVRNLLAASTTASIRVGNYEIHKGALIGPDASDRIQATTNPDGTTSTFMRW